jgi:hypothetical protein
VEASLPKENQPQKEQIKVTDKRIFTPEGEIREEFREEIKPAAEPARTQTPLEAPSPKGSEPAQNARQESPADRGRTIEDKASNPGTPFTNFLEPLVAQAYMSLGMLPNPYQPQGARLDVAAARQMIDILTVLRDKTAGNLTADEDDFLSTHLGELKLAYVKRTKSVG